jgi:hypothetical protein
MGMVEIIVDFIKHGGNISKLRATNLCLIIEMKLHFARTEIILVIGNPKQRIRHEINQISLEMLQNVRGTCYYRFAICQERNGAHFEHLLH